MSADEMDFAVLKKLRKPFAPAVPPSYFWTQNDRLGEHSRDPLGVTPSFRRRRLTTAKCVVSPEIVPENTLRFLLGWRPVPDSPLKRQPTDI
jgi:hypothetical protein